MPRVHAFVFCRLTQIVFAIAFASSPLHAQDSVYFFYRPLPYGSDAVYHPLGVFLHGGLDVLQSYNSSTRFDAIPWSVGARSVWQSVRSPGLWISRYGWERFLRQEVFPTSLDARKAQWIPNYFLHAVGGGMEYRKLSEWYDAHRFPLPAAFGAVTAMGYHYLNETVENGDGMHPNTDAIADLLIFDPLGIILFSFDAVAEYFADTWQMNDWSPQISVSLRPFAFRNFSQSFVAKYRISDDGRTNAFLYLGKSTLLGLSLKNWDERSVSFGIGATQLGVWKVDTTNEIPTNSIRVGAAAGVFYDRGNSLLASLIVSEYHLERVRINIYPGILGSGKWSPGFFFTTGDRGSVAFGVMLQMIPIGSTVYIPQ